MSTKPPTERTRAKRIHDRGAYDRETIYAVLDAGYICNVAYVIDGAPYVTPTIHWREGDQIYWHGSSASRMLRRSKNAEVCLSVMHNDGLVLARSGFHHSLNYRSVMAFGVARLVEGDDDKTAHLKIFVEGLYPGRWDALRPVTTQELKATTILTMPLTEASAKIRSGPPVDDEEDYALPVWAGIVPISPSHAAPEPCKRLDPEIPIPDYLGDLVNG